MTGLSLTECEQEREEIRKDLLSFMRAYDSVRLRIQEQAEKKRLVALQEWSGTSAVMGSMELAIHAMERTVQEYDVLIQRIRAGEIPNTDPQPPKLTVV